MMRDLMRPSAEASVHPGRRARGVVTYDLGRAAYPRGSILIATLWLARRKGEKEPVRAGVDKAESSVFNL